MSVKPSGPYCTNQWEHWKSTQSSEVRAAMTDFWEEHSQEASIEEMMLDTNAKELTQYEFPEILSYLPTRGGKDIIELGAGIGRFTGELAAEAKSVIAVDFMENFIQKNKETHGHLKNVEHRCADVTKLSLPSNSTDIVFSNWLMMYLNDEEVQNLIKNELLWIREGGYVFARESCFQQSGNKKRKSNPTKYRNPNVYMAFFAMLTIPTENEDEVFGFELVMSRSLSSYIKLKHNENQKIWLLQKLRRKANSEHGYKTFQEFLDNHQYSSNGILRYEKIFGRTYISTGGYDTTKEFVSRLNLQSGQVVLDVGCGIGGSAFYMVKDFGVKVIAIDLSANMIDIGMERAQEEGISEDKKWLRPGGKVLISDYCCSPDEHSEQFKAYVKQRGYNLLSPAQYGQVLESVGFVRVDAADRTDLFVESLNKELVHTESIRTDFVQEFSQKDYEDIVNGWKDKLKRTAQGDQRWGVFYAEKD